MVVVVLGMGVLVVVVVVVVVMVVVFAAAAAVVVWWRWRWWVVWYNGFDINLVPILPARAPGTAAIAHRATVF